MCAANLEPLEAREALEVAEPAVKEAAADKGRSIVLGTPGRTSDAPAGGYLYPAPAHTLAYGGQRRPAAPSFLQVRQVKL